MPRGRQIEFPPLQTHSRAFEYGCVIVALICVVIAVAIEAF